MGNSSLGEMPTPAQPPYLNMDTVDFKASQAPQTPNSDPRRHPWRGVVLAATAGLALSQAACDGEGPSEVNPGYTPPAAGASPFPPEIAPGLTPDEPDSETAPSQQPNQPADPTEEPAQTPEPEPEKNPTFRFIEQGNPNDPNRWACRARYKVSGNKLTVNTTINSEGSLGGGRLVTGVGVWDPSLNQGYGDFAWTYDIAEGDVPPGREVEAQIPSSGFNRHDLLVTTTFYPAGVEPPGKGAGEDPIGRVLDYAELQGVSIDRVYDEWWGPCDIRPA